jgi:hypothetical protein
MTAVAATDELAGADLEAEGAATGVWAVTGRVKAARQAEKTILRTNPPGRTNRDAIPFDPGERKMVPGLSMISASLWLPDFELLDFSARDRLSFGLIASHPIRIKREMDGH